MDGLVKEIQQGMNEEKAAADNILVNVRTMNETTGQINSASQNMRSQSTKLFGQIDELKNISYDTHTQSVSVRQSMGEIKTSSRLAGAAIEKNKEATDTVIEMVQGFKL